ncbi:MAG: hypothetical protein JWN44_5951 [Myxococcales bacterium]|nr:hypothetical protein [Myxococcales bacterium]
MVVWVVEGLDVVAWEGNWLPVVVDPGDWPSVVVWPGIVVWPGVVVWPDSWPGVIVWACATAAVSDEAMNNTRYGLRMICGSA